MKSRIESIIEAVVNGTSISFIPRSRIEILLSQLLDKVKSTIGKSGTKDGAEIFNDYENNVASEIMTHAEGGATSATKAYAHAEGYNTKSQGQASHSEGYSTTASGNYSHAEGYATTASSTNAHAEGYYAIAKGQASHAEGTRTVASSNEQHVQGKFNVEDASGVYAHIVGNGEDASNRSNAHTLDWEGNAWFAGSVAGTSVIVNSSTEGSTKKFSISVDDSGVVTATEVTD